MTLDEIKAALRLLDLGDEGSAGWNAGMVLLAATSVGANVYAIRRFTGLPLTLIRDCARNLRANGIWRGRVTYCEWLDVEDGDTAFLMDVLVAQGLLARVAA